ncbi:hypothetical protein Lalb_Chr20g0108941 [Lupinus albus]|uniref:Uncharacterized protein n=1 Tax=Lupinus albus TaxID=3870 RepID=A0A6A4NSD4_LUPAL|nr:hypothetical protein Lalb_Chr20g0108941 [Lupinus albus]
MGTNFEAKLMSCISILCSIMLLLTYFTTPSLSAIPRPTPYEVIRKYNFPVAVLPKGIIGYYLDTSAVTARLTINLKNRCSYKIQEIHFNYEPTAVLALNNDSQLISFAYGVQVEVSPNVWNQLKSVNRVNDVLKFNGPSINREASVSNFQVNPECEK